MAILSGKLCQAGYKVIYSHPGAINPPPKGKRREKFIFNKLKLFNFSFDTTSEVKLYFSQCQRCFAHQDNMFGTNWGKPSEAEILESVTLEPREEFIVDIWQYKDKFSLDKDSFLLEVDEDNCISYLLI